MGLLDHIESGLDNSMSLSFLDFANKNSLNHCAIFTKCDNNFVISNSIGFDGDTIISSLSTADFWNGSIKKNAWTYFSRTNNTIVTILQFFSKSLKDKINLVGTFYADDIILFVASEKSNATVQSFEQIKNDFKNVDLMLPNKFLEQTPQNQTNSRMKITFDYKNAMLDFASKYSSAINNENAVPKINTAIRAEIENKLRQLSTKDITFTKTETFKITCNVYSKNNMSIAALKSFVNLNLKPILGSSVNLISYAN